MIGFKAYICIMEINNVKVTEEEIRWVKMLSEGREMKDIAASENLPQGTFATKLSHVRTKYGCPNTTSLVAHFISNNLLEENKNS